MTDLKTNFLRRFDPNWSHTQFSNINWRWRFQLRGQESGNIKWVFQVNEKTNILASRPRESFDYCLVNISNTNIYTFNRVKNKRWFWDISTV